MFLDSTSNNWYWAYLTGNVEAGSHIGVRTGVTGKRRLTKEHSSYIEGTYFLNIPTEYHLSYVSSDDELWQQAGECSYLVTVNGVGTKRYKTGEKVTVNAADTEFAGTQTFLHWNPAGCTGLSPIENYLTESSPAKITFTMPNNDVHLKATYVYPVIKAKLRVVDDFIAGYDLPTTVLLQTWVEGASSVSERVPITWYKVNVDGSETEVSGKAEYGCIYRVRATVAPRLDDGMVFSDDLASATTVEVAGTDYTESAKIDDAGALEMVSSKLPSTAKAKVASIENVRITVNSGIKKSELVVTLPKTALATAESKDLFELETDRENADLPQGLISSDGKVADPDEGDTQEWKVTIPVKGSRAVADTDKELSVTVTVLKDATPVNTPEFVQEPGTYTRYDESRKLDGSGDLTVRVTVAGADAQTEIYYRINDGDEKLYNGADAIKLWHTSDVRKSFLVTVWAVRGNVKSSEIRGIYVLDDTLRRELKIACKDTAIDSMWGEYEDFTVTGNVGTAVTVKAPVKEGREFDHWEWKDAPDSTDLGSKKLVIPSFATDLDIVAVYAPVINSIRLEMSYPEAGKALSTAATKVLAKSGSGSEVDLKDVTEYFKGSDGKVHITWIPADSTAKAGVSYTARIDLSAENAPKGIKYALADEIDVDVEEGDEVITVEGSSVSGTDLIVQFPPAYTGLLESIEQPDDVTVSFTDALAGRWGLPEQAGLNLYGGSTDIGEISWEEPAGFDKNATDGQDLTVRGAVKVPSYVANEEVSTDVSLTIHVKAPAAIKAPVASLKEGVYEGAQSLALACETAGATIYYTLDGSKPTASSSIFKGTIELTESTVVKAIAMVDGVGESDIVTFTYTIKPKAKTHTVTFDTGLGSAVKAQEVADGACAKKPENPSLAGAVFKCWALIDGTEYDFSKTVREDMVLYAVWDDKDDPSPEPVPTVTVTFDAAGGSSVTTQKINRGACVAKPADPTRSGYAFSAWMLGKEVYDFSTPVTESITLTASWTKKDDSKGDSDKKDDVSDKKSNNDAGSKTAATKRSVTSKDLASTGDYTPAAVAALLVIGLAIVAAGIAISRCKK